MAEQKGVLIYVEVTGDRLASISQELLGCGRKLADELGEDLSAVLMGSGVKDQAQEAIAFGADRAYVVDDPVLKDYNTDANVAAMENVVKEAGPQILLMGQTSLGRDLAPRLAFRLDTALGNDCIELAIDPETRNLLQTRPVYGGNARATSFTESRPQMATVRQKVMSALERDDSRQGEIIILEAGVDPSQVRTKVLDTVMEEVVGVKLEAAPVVVTGGRGIGGPEGFEDLEELAKLFKGAVGATRSAADNGWVPSMMQVGLTGKIVTPDLYIAVALSGASQHMAGCSSAKNIVAVNKDIEANIFKEAQFGVVGDYKQVIPAFIAKVKELLAA
jgi:electron transfer flavoprotein alpha subunit